MRLCQGSQHCLYRASFFRVLNKGPVIEFPRDKIFEDLCICIHRSEQMLHVMKTFIYLKRYHFTKRANWVSWGNMKWFKRQTLWKTRRCASLKKKPITDLVTTWNQEMLAHLKNELRIGSLIKISIWPRTYTWTLFKSVLSFFRALAWYIIDISNICRYYKITITCILWTYWRIAKNRIVAQHWTYS